MNALPLLQVVPDDSSAAARIPNPSALEADFPGETVSAIAQAESWRKEIHRPATHTHKWWAQRLGSVFRAAIIAACSEDGSETVRRINEGAHLEGISVLDPFAGSGTTLVEALKLGASCTGVDINPVAGLVQRQALNAWDEDVLRRMFATVEDACRSEIDALHVDGQGNPVLYYFWVAQASCPRCNEIVDLFSSYVFAKHAYPRRYPRAQAICHACDSVNQVDLSKPRLGMCGCGASLDAPPPVKGQTMACGQGHQVRIIDALADAKPNYRMYAKLVLRDGVKEYAEIDRFDLDLYQRAATLLEKAEPGKIVRPSGALRTGYNTRQALRWGFNEWGDFFNARQLYCLGLLGRAVRDLPESAEREALCALFSGTLEFNNMFCSFKGEGTGAVRHMFSHHVLRPERVPLEAHPWGTPKSSGSFSTLFESRLIRANKYKDDPHDIVVAKEQPTRRHGVSRPIGQLNGASWQVLTRDAASLPHADDSFDLVVTDPPYFNNVHYSELADFFHSWLVNLAPHPEYLTCSASTRDDAEAQSTCVDEFGSALGRVFAESARVLKPHGILAFSFHHGTADAWRAVARALREAHLVITSVQPVKAEMSTSSTKNGSKEPNNLDSLVVCRHANTLRIAQCASPQEAADTALGRLTRLLACDVDVGLGDVRSVVTGGVMALATVPEADIDRLTDCARHLAENACNSWTG